MPQLQLLQGSLSVAEAQPTLHFNHAAAEYKRALLQPLAEIPPP